MTDAAAAFADRLFDLARAGDAAAVLDQVDAGVPVDLADAQGSTLLMLAAYHGHAQLVAGLAQRGADVDRVSGRGQTPLAGAVFKQHDDVIRVLLTAGADPDAGAPSARATAEMFGRSLPGE
ncbi:ankyrin repeat domain-containing protein [Microbacterium paludicola]|uniref:Ankyrin repeat domain-containing protein n=1 Tax=Microbacterium paludicola TaxID=300019 RepID=A0A4Y9FQH0_9MICO|nr:ankyrin repeat domain-containing protein [Microbacterium paludicola]MBF0817383.1 ankyrin repeat domain-containing protein [Microbacterium paludicola]TFU31477.1 ankyrin repeat domain-containing protein [Microbacterium paludicola]